MGSGGIGSPGGTGSGDDAGSGPITLTDGAGLSYVLDEIVRTAEKWRENAAVIGSISPEAESLALDPVETWIFGAMVNAYNSVVRYVAGVTSEGQAQMTDIANELQQTVEYYGAVEDKNTNIFKGAFGARKRSS